MDLHNKKNINNVIVLIILILILFLPLSFLNNNNDYLYLNKSYAINEVKYDYPYFNSVTINNDISSYLKSNYNNQVYKIDYKVNLIDNMTSILFTKYNKDNAIIGYDGFLYDKNNKFLAKDKFIINEKAFKDKVIVNALNKNIELPSLELKDMELYLNGKSLVVYIKSDSYNYVLDIDYNELKGIINLKYNYDPSYTALTTTTKKKDLIKTANQLDKTIAFTFDDGPSVYTLDILNILDKYNYKATFFEVGYMMKRKPDITKEVIGRGYEVGNHTVDHSNLNKLSTKKIKDKLSLNNEYFNSITGIDMQLVRPPYGSCNSKTKKVISNPIILWSVDSRDWESKNTSKIVSLVKNEVSDGDIVLFHDLYRTTREAIEILVPYLNNLGYNIVSVSELFKIKGIELENGHIYRKAS